MLDLIIDELFLASVSYTMPNNATITKKDFRKAIDFIIMAQNEAIQREYFEQSKIDDNGDADIISVLKSAEITIEDLEEPNKKIFGKP